MAANTGYTDRIINHINNHGSITPGQIGRYTTREPHKVIGDVNKSLYERGEEWGLWREGNRYYAYTVAEAA